VATNYGIKRPNASAHLPPEAGATEERTLEAVRCSAVIMIEASPLSIPRGMLALGKKPLAKEEGDLRRFYTQPHPLYCGIDRHARSMDVCLVRQRPVRQREGLRLVLPPRQRCQGIRGQTLGPLGQKIGNAHRKWAFAEAAVLVLRPQPAGQPYLARLAHKHGKGKALTILAHKLARVVSDLLTRTTAFDLDQRWPG
jgi:hypothetical protein